MYVAGVDVGSTATKAIILDENKQIVGRGLGPTGANVVRAAERAYAQAREQAGCDDWEVDDVVGTGYGRYKVPFGNTQMTEIGCHGKGGHFLFPNTRTILDIGGQDTKVIKVTDKGEVDDFCMNDKCAAGTGRFLEASAGVMGIELDDIGEFSMRSERPLRMTNMCTVFVESEILSHVAAGRKIEDILRGVNDAIAGRSVALMRRVGLDDEITFTGGVSRNTGMVRALEARLERKINVSPDSQFIGAIGAALFAWERTQQKAGAA